MLRGGEKMSRIINSRMGRIQDVSLIKQTAGTRDENGEYVPGSVTSMPLRAVVQPVTYQGSTTMREALPEGFRLSDYRYVDIYTRDADLLKPVRIGTPQTQPDVLEFEGLRWSVVDVTNWIENGHLVATVVREDAQNG